jgi:N-acetylglucosaminyldiphosphoundecaprenol N-acetyl-beta-D-mannosaminyltransferase
MVDAHHIARAESIGRPDGVHIMDTWVDRVTMEGAVAHIEALIESVEFSYTVTPNVDHLVKLRTDPHFRAAYATADLAVPDGVPLLWASRLIGSPLPERVNGTDLVERLSEMAARNRYSVYLMGGSPQTASAAADILRLRYPGLKVAGYSCPPVGFDRHPSTNDPVVEAIADSGADILFVALGAPKQEKWIMEHADRTGVSHAIGIGGSFALISGHIHRAPDWAQRRGLEWAWRLAHEPKRLWRRYLVDDLPFMRYLAALAITSKVGATRAPRFTGRRRP